MGAHSSPEGLLNELTALPVRSFAFAGCREVPASQVSACVSGRGLRGLRSSVGGVQLGARGLTQFSKGK